MDMDPKTDKRKVEGSGSGQDSSSSGMVKKPKSSSSKKEKKPTAADEQNMRKRILTNMTKIEEYEALIELKREETEKLKVEYLTTFKKPFDKDEEVEDDTKLTAEYTKRDQHLDESKKFPLGGKICQVCDSRVRKGFSDNDEVLMCTTCLDSIKNNNLPKSNKKYRQIKCVCPQQLRGQGQPGWRVYDCMSCKLIKIKSLYPDLYTAENLVPAHPPDHTQPGHFGHFMEMTTVRRENVRSHTFFSFYLLCIKHDLHKLTLFCSTLIYLLKEVDNGINNTVALIVTLMDLNQINDRTVNGVELKGERVIGFVLLRLEFDDPRLDSPLSLQQLTTKRSRDARSLKGSSSHKVGADLVHVDMELIQWSPTNFTNSLVAANSHKMVHYLLIALLNSVQNFPTRVPKLNMQAKYLTLDSINSYMKKREVESLRWRVNKTPATPLVGPQLGKRGRHSTTIGTTSVTSNDREDYLANIYGYFLKKDNIIYVNIGSHNGPYPRLHEPGSNATLGKFLMANKNVEYFSTILVHLKSNEKLHKLQYEGQVQTIFKLAELHGVTFDQLSLPFPDSAINYGWLALDKRNLPQLPIRLLNDTIEARQMNWPEFQFFINLPRLFFGMELRYPDLYYEGERDPLQFTMEPNDPSMDVEEDPDEN